MSDKRVEAVEFGNGRVKFLCISFNEYLEWNASLEGKDFSFNTMRVYCFKKN
jgi:hypothetical protein